MKFAYLYFMKSEQDRVRATAPHHAAYWQGRALRDDRGGPFADRSGGLITFEADTSEEAEQIVSGDPFVQEGLLERTWINEWLADAETGSMPRTAHASALELKEENDDGLW